MRNEVPMIQLHGDALESSTKKEADNNFHNGTSNVEPRNVRAKLLYSIRDPETRPWNYRRPRGPDDPHPADTGGENELKEVEIRDGRFYNTKALHSGNYGKDLDDRNLLTLDSCGFELAKVPEVNDLKLSLEDFYGGRRIQNEYYPVIAEFVKKHTGAAHVKITSHTLRNGKMMNRKNLPTEPMKERAQAVSGYAHMIHGDYTESAATSSFKRTSICPDERHYRKGRFAIFCVWKSIRKEPVKNDPLCLLDERSLLKDDKIDGDVFGYGFQTSVYRLDKRNAHKHRWYYFPHMESDEVVIFKHYDSDPNCRSTTAFHTSFTDPLAPPETMDTRESIDLRMICYFPDHTPNTCPEIGTVPTDEECAQLLATKVIIRMAGMVHLNIGKWPGHKTEWVVERVRDGGADGLEEVIQNAVADEEGVFELSDKSDTFRNMVASVLRENNRFEKTLKQSISQIKDW